MNGRNIIPNSIISTIDINSRFICRPQTVRLTTWPGWGVVAVLRFFTSGHCIVLMTISAKLLNCFAIPRHFRQSRDSAFIESHSEPLTFFPTNFPTMSVADNCALRPCKVVVRRPTLHQRGTRRLEHFTPGTKYNLFFFYSKLIVM